MVQSRTGHTNALPYVLETLQKYRVAAEPVNLLCPQDFHLICTSREACGARLQQIKGGGQERPPHIRPHAQQNAPSATQ
jgi:hypothetical protein